MGLPPAARHPGEPATGYYGAAKVVAIGLVVAGGALFGRRRARQGAGAEDGSGPDVPDTTGR
ncbi:hypothetical protein [Streptomyces sp. NPDC059639]|uniref:hypothetical protein n=1 Tax=Streptomyces sp. NPDC059639 TaxID=3346891 RepID=UPI003687F447